MCHFAVASRNTLFCSASEWPLFFRVFSFFPRLIFNTGTAFRYCATVQSTPRVPSVAALLGCELSPPAVLFGCLLPGCAQLATAEVSPLRSNSRRTGRSASNSRSARAYTQLAMLEVKLTAEFDWICQWRPQHPLHHLIRQAVDVCFIISSWPRCYSSSFDSEDR